MSVLPFYQTVAGVWHRKLGEDGELVQAVCKAVHPKANLRDQSAIKEIMPILLITGGRYCAGCRKVDARHPVVAP
jgi:hypothetical protein